jgi:ribosomal protein S14
MVEVWSWIIGYAVLFAVVQLAIYAYYVRRGESGNPRASAIGDPDEYAHAGDRVKHNPTVEDDLDDARPAQRPTDDTDDTDVRACPHCGTPNESIPTVKYCRCCTRSLG